MFEVRRDQDGYQSAPWKKIAANHFISGTSARIPHLGKAPKRLNVLHINSQLWHLRTETVALAPLSL